MNNLDYKLHKLALEHSWNWYKYQAEQRLIILRFFIILFGVIITSLISALNYEKYFISLFISFLGAIFSFLFYFFDKRNQVFN